MTAIVTMTLRPCLRSSSTRGPPANSHRNLKIATNLSFKAFCWATLSLRAGADQCPIVL